MVYLLGGKMAKNIGRRHICFVICCEVSFRVESRGGWLEVGVNGLFECKMNRAEASHLLVTEEVVPVDSRGAR